MSASSRAADLSGQQWLPEAGRDSKDGKERTGGTLEKFYLLLLSHLRVHSKVTDKVCFLHRGHRSEERAGFCAGRMSFDGLSNGVSIMFFFSFKKQRKIPVANR